MTRRSHEIFPSRPPKGAHSGTWQRGRELWQAGASPQTAVAELLRWAGEDGSHLRAVEGMFALEIPGWLEALRVAANGEEETPPRRLIRRVLGREEGARERRNPILRNEDFTCLHCGLEVSATRQGPPRSHCPGCLRSLHVDVVPGDRREGCASLMDPVSVLTHGEEVVFLHRCRACGFERRARLLLQADPQPDSQAVLLLLAAQGEP